MTTKVLVTGGAGYIGAHTCLALAQHGFEPIAFDNLSHGHHDFVKWGPLALGDVREREAVEAALARYRPDAVIHLAGLIDAPASWSAPAAFYEHNVIGTLNLLFAMYRTGVPSIVFSSSCATYGIATTPRLDESHRQLPLTPYGQSKWMSERTIEDFARHATISSVILRYFNAAGADLETRIGERHDPETHVIPLAITAALKRQKFTLHGTDFDTRDGTCERDFTHVCDIADAHVRAVDYLLNGGASCALNVGSGAGTTVRELLLAIEQTSSRRIDIVFAERRLGDAPSLIADCSRIDDKLGWRAQHNLEAIVASALEWHRSETR